MVKGLAFIALAILLLGMTGAWIVIELGQRRSDLDRRLAVLSNEETAPLRRRPVALPDRFTPLLSRAQLEISRRTLWAVGAAYLAANLFLLVWQGPLQALIAIILIPAGVLAWINRRADMRVEALIEALPHYVDGVRQLLAVGASLPQALLRALADAPPVVTQFLTPVSRRLELGAPVDEVMQQLADRLKIPEVAMLAAAVKTNIRFGGSISAVLINLSQLLRERSRVKRDLRAATAEARVSAKVLIGMPLVSMGLLFSMNPEYPMFFLNDPRGQTMGIVALSLQVLGTFFMNRQMKLEF